MEKLLFYNADIVNEGKRFRGYVMTDGEFIESVGTMDSLSDSGSCSLADLTARVVEAVDCEGRMLLPGVIDTHVHFRDPGLTEKGDMASESRAAIAGGVTSFIDMPNTKPATVSREALEAKLERAAGVSAANYGFFIGATNDNIDELLAADYNRTAGVKLFLGSSTGNMLVDDSSTLGQLFREAPALIAVHAEDENIIRRNRELLLEECGGTVPVERHPDLRPREACVEATRRAIELARRSGARLHVCHISTADELQMIAEAKADGVKITAETCPQYLLFDRGDFIRLGARIKCNPSVKESSDRIALLRALMSGGVIDTIATDHAPHLLSQKQGDALTAASGMPMVQFSLRALLELADSEPELEQLTPERIAELMCHRPAELLGIDRRGYIRPGFYADLVLVGKAPVSVKIADTDAESLCGWTPLAGMTLGNTIDIVTVNGRVAYRNGKHLTAPAKPLKFNTKI